jgi:hypothetical protein
MPPVDTSKSYNTGKIHFKKLKNLIDENEYDLNQRSIIGREDDYLLSSELKKIKLK